MIASSLTLTVLISVWCGVGVSRTLVATHLPRHHIVHALRENSLPVVVHGIVVSDPVDLLNPNEEGQSAVVSIHHAKIDQRWRPVTGLVRARILEPRNPLIYGDELLVEGDVFSVPSPGNPGQYDWKAALARHHIQVLLSVKPHHVVVTLRGQQGRWWMAAVYALQHRIERLIDEAFRPEHAALLRSFLLGQRTTLDEGLKRALVETGTIHLLVVSGFNVGLIAWLLEIGLRWLGWPLRTRLVGSGVCLLGYCLLTGMQAPVLRATVMAWMVLGAIWLDRLIHWPNALAAAALVILWMNPLQLFDPGFQLSFGAVASLLVFTPRLQAWITARLPTPRRAPPTAGLARDVAPGASGGRPERGEAESRDDEVEPRTYPVGSTTLPWISRYVSLTLAGTCAVWIGLWPVLAWYFHLVAPVSIMANLLLVPLVSMLVSAGTVMMLAGAVVTPLVAWSSGLFSVLLETIVACVRWCHQVPAGWWVIGHPSWWLIAGYYGLVMVTLMRRRLRFSHGQLLACWLLGVNLCIWSRAIASIRQAAWLEVTTLDVGHGDALVIRTSSRQTLLIDTGTQEAGQYVLVPFLRYQGVGEVDALILTHFDEDHIGGAIPLLQSARVRHVFTNGGQPTTPTGRQVLALARAQHIPIEPLSAGLRLTGLSGAEMIVLHPPRDGVPGTRRESNDNSVVIRLSRARVSGLFCGDIEEAGLPWLLAWGEGLRATMLKVPHHGSALGSSSLAFVEQVAPSVAILSVGRRHGLPSMKTLNNLNAVSAQVLSTRQDGAVTIRTDGTRLLVTRYRGAAK